MSSRKDGFTNLGKAGRIEIIDEAVDPVEEYISAMQLSVEQEPAPAQVPHNDGSLFAMIDSFHIKKLGNGINIDGNAENFTMMQQIYERNESIYEEIKYIREEMRAIREEVMIVNQGLTTLKDFISARIRPKR